MKYRAEVAGKNENVWSSNAIEYDTPEEAKNWLKDLAGRWTGFDMSRVVTVDTPTRQTIDPNDSKIFQNFRR